MEATSAHRRPRKRVLLKRANTPFQADVWRVERTTGPVVVKSFERRLWPFRVTIGRWITAREVRNLRDLDGIPGIPQLVGRPAPWTFEMTFIEAQDLPAFDTRETVTAQYFDALDTIVGQMHARGISHGDLRRRNLLRDPESGQPVVLDFAQSITPRDWLLRPLLPLAFRIDRVKLLRLRQWFVGTENLTREQQREFRRRAPTLLRIGRFLRRRFYRPFKYWYLGKQQRARKTTAEGSRR